MYNIYKTHTSFHLLKISEDFHQDVKYSMKLFFEEFYTFLINIANFTFKLHLFKDTSLL